MHLAIAHPYWCLASVTASPTIRCFLAASPPLRLTCSSAATSTEAVERIKHRAKIRPICLNIVCVHSLICLIVWRGLFSRCACPALVSPFCSSCTPPLQMAWRIQLDMPRADSTIEVEPLLRSLLFFYFFSTLTQVLLPGERHSGSCQPHLAELPSSLPLSAVVQHCPLRCVWVLWPLFHRMVKSGDLLTDS